MTATVKDNAYNRKRQRLLSNGSSKSNTIPKKQHYSNNVSLSNEVINLDSEDEDYVFNPSHPSNNYRFIPEDKDSEMQSDGNERVAVNFDDSIYDVQRNSNFQNINSDPFATQENITNSNLDILQNHASSNVYNNLSNSSIDSANLVSNEIDHSTYHSYNYNYEYEYNAIMENADNDEAIIDDDNLTKSDFEETDNDANNMADSGTYNDYVNNYMKPQTRHLSFTKPFSIFKRFSKKTEPSTGSTGSHNIPFSTKSKQRTKSLPQLSYSKLTYSPALDQNEVSMKVGDIQASLISHTNYTYNTDNNISPKLRKFSFQNNNRFDKSSGSSTRAYSGSTKSTETSSYDDKYINKSDLNLINYKIDEDVVEDEICDDNDGYYIVKNGAPFANGRFTIKKLLGQGTFGKVVKAYDHQTNSDVAIKIIKSIKKYREASKIELRVLTMLKKHDPTNKFQCIHLRECFDYRDHICIVTDLLKISLYDFMEKNSFLPFPGSHIQAMVKQLLRSVAFMHDLKLIHTDLKPENILIKDASYRKKPYHKPEDGRTYYRKILKDPKIYTIDFGSAIFQDEYHSSIISTRHYRAPEIILGVGWSFPCDIWSVGAIMIELLTGEALFKTHENPQHLAMMEKIIGKHVDVNMVRKCINLYKNKSLSANSRFDASIINAFNKRTGQLIFGPHTNDQHLVKEVENMKTIEDLVEEKVGLKFDISIGCKEAIRKYKIAPNMRDTYTFWYYYIDLIKKMLVFNPEERITAKDALNHEWFEHGIYDDGVE